VIHANVELALFLRSGETSWTNKTLVTSRTMAIGFLVFDRSLACLSPTYHFSWRTNTKQRGCKPGPSNGICWMTFLSKRSTSDSETCGSPEWFLVLSAGVIIVVLTSLLIRIRPPARKQKGPRRMNISSMGRATNWSGLRASIASNLAAQIIGCSPRPFQGTSDATKQWGALSKAFMDAAFDTLG